MYNCRLCDNLILSQTVTFAADTLTVNIPAGAYGAGECYCIVLAQAIPAATTITAPVEITIGTGTETYPLVDCRGVPVLAADIRTRTRYRVRVTTTPTGGTFRLLGRVGCHRQNNLAALDGTAPAAEEVTP